MAITKATFAVDNVQGLADLVKDQAALVKQTFDKTGADTKAYINDVLTAEIDTKNDSQDLAIVAANNSANSAVNTANGANIKSDAAVSTANLANGKADTAVLTANSADGKADAAVLTANEAKGTADSVQSDYTALKPVLEQAVADAEAAVEAVAGKADVSYVDQVAADFVLGTITDNSLTNAKLGTDIKIGSLADLTTTEQASVVGAINEVKSDVGGVSGDLSDLAGDGRTTETVKGVADDLATLSGTVTSHMAEYATDLALGHVKVDGTTITSTEGVISASIPNIAIPALYERDVAISGSKVTVSTPNSLWVNINGLMRKTSSSTALSLSSASSWDSTATDYTISANRAGKNFYVYACEQSTEEPKFVLSANSTVPAGYTASTSRKVGGFHCLSVAVGTISGHTLTGYVAGDILPQSVWDLKHKPRNNRPEGMVYDPKSNLWIDIYLVSGTGINTASVNGGTICDNRNWMDFVDDLGAVGKRMLTDIEFQLASSGCNEGTNIAGGADPGTTTGHTDTAGRRMISNIGCEDMAGVMWQWIDEQSYQYAGTSSFAWVNQTGNKGQLYLQGGTADVKLVAGGSWVDGAHCGSRGRLAADYRWHASAFLGCRAGVEPA